VIPIEHATGIGELSQVHLSNSLNFPNSIFRVSVVAKNNKVECDLTEKWYGAKYAKRDIDPETLEKWRTSLENPTTEHLHLPQVRNFYNSFF
jgi:hypothetical protein